MLVDHSQLISHTLLVLQGCRQGQEAKLLHFSEVVYAPALSSVYYLIVSSDSRKILSLRLSASFCCVLSVIFRYTVGTCFPSL